MNLSNAEQQKQQFNVWLICATGEKHDFRPQEKHMFSPEPWSAADERIFYEIGR